MRAARSSWIVKGCLIFACVCVGGGQRAQAAGFFDWQAAQAAATGRLTSVTLANGERIFSGYEVDDYYGTLHATIYSASGSPGSASVTQTDLGLTLASSVSVSVAENGAGGYWATAIELLPSWESRSYIFASADLGNPIPVIGPAPAFDPDVSLNAINRAGLAVGTIGLTVPVISTASGVTTQLSYPYEAELWGVDSAGQQLAGAARPTAGGEMVATIFDSTGAVLMQDSLPGIAWDVEGPYAVGARDGKAAYWINSAGSWQAYYVEDGQGAPLSGELFAIDHGDSRIVRIAGGYIDPLDRPIVLDIRTGNVTYVEQELSLPQGTLRAVRGVHLDSATRRAAFALQASDYSGWDVTAAVPPGIAVPGPGAWLALTLIGVGFSAARGRK